MSSVVNFDINAINTDIDAVKFIEQRREMLQRVSNLVNAIQRLTSSLDVLMVSTGTNEAVADKTFGLLDYLDDKQKNLSTSKIEIRLEALDISIRDQLSKILSAVHESKGVEVSHLEMASEAPDPLDEVSEFRRKVRLSMAYRLLLVERGMDVQPINLDVAPELISGCMKQLEVQEAFYKDKLLNDMKGFHSDVVTLLKNKALSSKLISALKTAAKQLKLGVQFIKSNKPIEVLPEVLDVSEFLDIKDDEGEVIVHEDAPKEDLDSDAESQKGGFFSTLNTWLSTPGNVSWEQAKKKK